MPAAVNAKVMSRPEGQTVDVWTGIKFALVVIGAVGIGLSMSKGLSAKVQLSGRIAGGVAFGLFGSLICCGGIKQLLRPSAQPPQRVEMTREQFQRLADTNALTIYRAALGIGYVILDLSTDVQRMLNGHQEEVLGCYQEAIGAIQTLDALGQVVDSRPYMQRFATALQAATDAAPPDSFPITDPTVTRRLDTEALAEVNRRLGREIRPVTAEERAHWMAQLRG
jgi:hypothetical protein